jgi:hypothetical protein
LWITGEAGTNLYTVDTSGGAPTFIGAPGHNGVVVLAFHPNGTLYTFTESITSDPAVPEQLATFNRLTGEATNIGSPLPERTQIMPGAISPDGTMFAAGITGSLTSKLLTIDLETGQPTVIGPFGVDGMMDFAFDLDGTLFGATGSALYTINTFTGEATKVVDLGGDIGAGWGVMGIHIAGDGTLFATDLVFDGDGSSLYQVDRDTGIGTRVVYLGMMLAHSADMAPPSPAERAHRLTALVAAFVAPGGTAQSLLAKVQGVSSAIGGGRTTAACGMLSAFRNEVRALSGRSLTAAHTRQLDVDAQWTETSLDCNR